MKRLNCILLMIMLVFSSSLVFAEGNETVTKTNVENEIKSSNKEGAVMVESQIRGFSINDNNNIRWIYKNAYCFNSTESVVYIPVLVVCKELGFTVAIDEATKSFTINDSAQIQLGERMSGNIDLGGKVALIYDNIYAPVLYAPISFYTEVLGLNVEATDIGVEIKGESLIKKNQKTELTEKEKKADVVPHDSKYTGEEYSTSQGRVGGLIGSNENNQKTDRPKDASFEQDREYFNYMTGNIGYKINKYGQLAYEELINESVSDTQVGFKISRNENEEPVVHCWDWAVEKTTYRPRILHMNLAMEGFKYYAKSNEDGKAIWAYVDNAFKTHTDLDTGKVHKFGQTKVKFHDPGFWGIDVVFVNDRDADQVVDIKEEQPLRINNKFISRTPEKGYSFISNNSDVYVPVKLVSEELGHTFKYDKSTKRVTINNSVNLQVGKSMCGDIDIGGKVAIINDVIYTPVSFYTEVLGIEVDFKNVNGITLLDINGENSTKKTQKTELTYEEKKEGIVAHDIKYTGLEYLNKEGHLSSRIGSLKNNKKSYRSNYTTFSEDIEYFNFFLEFSNYQVNEEGLLVNYFNALNPLNYDNHLKSGFKISRNENDKPVVRCWEWDDKGGTTEVKKILRMNLAMEGFKYYAKTDEDGKSIWAYVDNAFKSGTDIFDGKIHKFGETKVKFEKSGNFGIDVVFIND